MAEEQPPKTQATPGKDVFISYASHDKGVAEDVCRALEAHGVRCWIAPRDVVPGESFAGAIVHAIDSTKGIVLILSEHAADSQHVLREVERATSKRHVVIAFRLDMKPLPADFEYFLNTSQWLDASATGVRRALPKLVEAVRGATAHAPATPDAMPATTAATAIDKRWRPALIATVALVLAIAAYLLIERFPLSKPGTAPVPVTSTNRPPDVSEKSIAILPFVDMSEKHDQEYFSDGLSEELIDHLTHFPDLKVIARTSSFAFKGKNEDMRSIATKLGVANLLEGSVRKAGGELRITAQLIRASDGVHLWSETYDRRLTDIFKVQEEISTTVARALNAALNKTSVADANAPEQGTTNIAAYNLLLQSNYFFWRGEKGDDAKAVAHLLQALKLDPNYAQAWAKLARTYAWQGDAGILPPAEAEAKGRAAAERALALNPSCAEAYYARANISRFITGDWSAAISDNERAAALEPQGEIGDNARANNMTVRADTSGRYGEAISFAHQRLVRDPLDVETMSDLVYLEQNSGHFDEAAAISQRLLELNSGYVGANAQYAETLMLMGKNAEALVAAEKEPHEANRSQILSCVHWAMGRRAESDSALAALERGFSDRRAYEIASVHACRGETDAAFAWLDRAYLQKKGSLHALRSDFLFRKLHADPRFDALLRKAKLVE